MQTSQKTKQAQKRNRGDKSIKRLQINRRGRPEINQTYVLFLKPICISSDLIFSCNWITQFLSNFLLSAIWRFAKILVPLWDVFLFSIPTIFLYIRMAVVWFTMVVLDAMTGFRVELLWPAWLMIRAVVESVQLRNQHCVTTIASPSSPVSTFFIDCRYAKIEFLVI